jgi:hypothetical protein
MESTHDWLPKNHEALFDQSERTTRYLALNRDRLGLGIGTPQGTWLDTEFDGKYLPFLTAYNKWKDPATRTSLFTVTLEEAEEEFKKVYRTLYTGLLKNSPLVSNEDLAAMSLPTRDGGGGGHNPPPTTHVGSSVRLTGPGELEIDYFDQETHKKGKPKGVHGVEIGWVISEVPPEDWGDLTRSSFDTRSPFRMTFERHQRGQTLYFALRWENTVGEKGPWSDIQNAIIP